MYYMDVLFLFFVSILEVGTSNIFFFWINEEGEKELVTPHLNEGTILPGVIRDTILVRIIFSMFLILFFRKSQEDGRNLK